MSGFGLESGLGRIWSRSEAKEDLDGEGVQKVCRMLWVFWEQVRVKLVAGLACV